MRISFAVTTHNEGELIERLLSQLTEFIEGNDTDDEIVILDDYSEDSDTVRILETYSNLSYTHLHRRALERDFGAQKSYLNTLCSGDFIFQIDADELLSPDLLENLHTILEANYKVDLFYVPRVNTVEGLTEEHIQTWGWNVNEHGWVLWPDWQTRLYKNKPEIMWGGKVHERIDGFENYASFPEESAFAIIHHKSIERQEEQNAFYSEIIQNAQEFE
jgi:glycosyltransferase involved in cell wall biosynthesis